MRQSAVASGEVEDGHVAVLMARENQAMQGRRERS
jgi:hypothetical protein